MCMETPSLCTLSIQLYVNHVPLRTRWSPILFTARQQLIVGTWHSSPHQLRDQHLSSQIPKPPWSKQPNASDCGFWLSRFLDTSPFISLCSFPCQLVRGTMSFLYCMSFVDIAVWLVWHVLDLVLTSSQSSKLILNFDQLSNVGDRQDNVAQSKIDAQCFWEQLLWWEF